MCVCVCVCAKAQKSRKLAQGLLNRARESYFEHDRHNLGPRASLIGSSASPFKIANIVINHDIIMATKRMNILVYSGMRPFIA